MILSQKHPYNLQFPLLKVHSCYPCYQETLIVICSTSQPPQYDSLLHFDKYGKVLKTHNFKSFINAQAMFNNFQVLVLDVQSNMIVLINLKQWKIEEKPFYFMIQVSCQVYLQSFSLTKYFCIRQNGDTEKSQFRLSYFIYDQLQKEQVTKPFYQFQAINEEQQWTYQHVIKKGNEHSMIIWFKPRSDHQFMLKVIDLRKYQFKKESIDQSVYFRSYVINNTIGDPYERGALMASIHTVWQMQKDIFCLVLSTQKTLLNLTNNEGVINNNYIWDTTLQQMRQTNFTFHQKYNDYQIDISSNHKYSIFKTFFFQKNKTLQSPIYYINNSTEKIEAQQKWKCTHKSKSIDNTAYNYNLFIQAEYQNGDVDQIIIKKTKIVDYGGKEAYVHLAYQYLMGIVGEQQNVDENMVVKCVQMLSQNQPTFLKIEQSDTKIE